MGDPYLQANGTLKNRLGIDDAGRLERREAEWHHLRAQGLRKGDPRAVTSIETTASWGLDRLKAIHRHLFGDVYDWAGTTRAEPFIDTSANGRLVKTDFHIRKTGMKKAFAEPGEIVGRMAHLERWLGDVSSLKGLKRIDLAIVAADTLTEVNRIHPFREGNGRAQRAFVRGIVNASGRDIDFSAITARRMVQASDAGMSGNRDVMRRLVRDAMSTERTRKLHDVRKSYADSGIDWNNMYVGFAEPDRDHLGSLIVAKWGSPGHFEARIDDGNRQTSLVVGRTRDLADMPAEDAYGTPAAFRPRGKPTPRDPPVTKGWER